MESPKPAAVTTTTANKKKGFRYKLLRCSIATFLYLLFLVSVSVIILLLAVVIWNLSISNPISVPCQCKIVSSRKSRNPRRFIVYRHKQTNFSTYKSLITGNPFLVIGISTLNSIYTTMDSPEPAAADTATTTATADNKKGFRYALMCCSFAIFLYLLFFVLASITILLLAVVIGNLSISNPIFVPCQCRIVSSSVDLRSSKVCELGLLNYKATHVFYPSEKKKFRCRYDYYWASVFKVEYIDHSGQSQLALAEAPNEALPPDCRPTFGSAWLTKDKFKVNETYNCWYTLGISKLHIYHDEFFNCQANNPSTIEMLRRYSILFTRVLMSWLTKKGRAKYWRWEVVAGVVSGFSTALITISLGRLLFQVKSSIQRFCAGRIGPLSVHTLARLKRGCFLVAYFSFVSWLSIQYGKRLGFPEIFRSH